MQTVREQKELEHLEAAATILAKAGIQENVYLFGSSRGGFSATGSQTLGLSGRLTGVLLNTGRTLASDGTLLRSGRATSGLSGMSGVNRATQALQGTRRTVAFESGLRPRDLFTPGPPPKPEQEALLGVTGHSLGFRETRRVVEQNVGGLGTGLRLLTAADVSASGRRFLRTQTAPVGARALAPSRSSTLTRAQTLGRVLGRTGLFESLRSGGQTAASLGSASFVALAETMKSGRFDDVSNLQSDARSRVSWASDDEGRPEAFGSGTVRSEKLMRTETRRRGFQGDPRGAPVQRELFRVRSGGAAERNGGSAERNAWGGDEEPEVWEHRSAEFRPVSRSASLRSRSGTERNRTDSSTQKSKRLSASERRRVSGECPSEDSFSGSELVPADRAEPFVSDAAFRSRGVRKSTGNFGRTDPNGFESRFEKLEDTAERAYSAAAAATSGAEAWVHGLVTSGGRRTSKSVRHRSGTGALPAEQTDAFVEEGQADFAQKATSTAERRLEELGGVRLLRRTMTRGAHSTGFAGATQRVSAFADDKDSGGLSADARALRDAILMQAASSRQAYEELCDVIARFAGAGRVFGGDDLRALDTVAGGRGFGVPRATARGFEKGRVAKMMRKLMAKLGDPGFDAKEDKFESVTEKSGARSESARGVEVEIPVKQERKETVRRGGEVRDDVADDVSAAVEHARNLAAARIQVRSR